MSNLSVLRFFCQIFYSATKACVSTVYSIQGKVGKRSKKNYKRSKNEGQISKRISLSLSLSRCMNIRYQFRTWCRTAHYRECPSTGSCFPEGSCIWAGTEEHCSLPLTAGRSRSLWKTLAPLHKWKFKTNQAKLSFIWFFPVYEGVTKIHNF